MNAISRQSFELDQRTPANAARGLLRYCLALCAAMALSACVYDNNQEISAPSEQPLQISTSGAGTVVSDPNGISCGTQCTANYSTDTEVVLTAQAASGYTFASWSGSGLSCPGTRECRVSMRTARSIHASFNRNVSTATLSVSAVGQGTITSSPAGISCGTDCSTTVNVGTQITLNAAPADGYTFNGWSGSGIACPGTGACVVSVDSATNVTATFSPVVATTFALNVGVTGSGSVASNPAGIACPSACTKSYDAGTSVTLTATPATGYSFAGWNATGTSCGAGNTCTVSMDAARSVTATFTQNAPTTYALTVAKLGLGTVTSAPAGINCGTTCTATYAANASVVLSATPSTGYEFIGWSGNGVSCSGTGSCTVTMSAARNVTATFSAVTVATYTLSVSKTGTGTVTSTPSGISCGSTCSASYTAGTSVTLTAAAGSGSTFSGWSGACSGSSTTCTVTLSQARSANATFTTTSTGGGGGTPTGTPDWTRTETPTNWDYTAEVASRSACAANEGVTYEVGPGKTYSRAAQVPWLKLMPCDQVLFYYSSTPYTDIIFVGSRGEKNKWITIAGVAGPNGERPIFDGNGAIMPSGTGANSYSDSSGMIEVLVPDSSVVTRASLYKPGYLHITGLKFQNVRPPAKVTKLSGSTSTWAEFSAGIYLVGTEHVLIDYCEFADNGLGIFANSGGDQYMQTRYLTISHNYFHGNGISGKASEHNAYTEGIGTVYEYNYFGAPVTGTGGDNIKERSAGVIFRYNYIEDGVDLISLRDPESNADYEAAALDAQGEPLVSKAFIYSNIFVARNPTIYGEAPIIVAHGDGPFGTNKQVRYGQLFFYNNRVVSMLNTATQLSATPVFDFLNTRAATTVVARNNLFYATNKTASGTAAPFALYYWQGQADWSSNWINKFQNVYASSADGGLAAGTKFSGSGLGGLTAQSGDPGFVNASASNFLTTSSSPYATLNGSLPTAVTVRGLTPAAEPVVTPFGK